jgi:Xaa-Pro aminopeptidase
MIRVTAAALVVLLLSSCASVADRVQAALDSAASATASVSTVLTQLGDDRALPPFADTVIGDALSELDGAASDLTGLGPVGDPGDRDAALAAIREAQDAVLAARQTVASGGDSGRELDGVEAAATDALRRVP